MPRNGDKRDKNQKKTCALKIMVSLLFPQAKKIAHEIQTQLEQLDRGVDAAAVQRQAQQNLSQLEEHIATLEKKVNYESAQTREIWRK